jgi:hypothetical protein
MTNFGAIGAISKIPTLSSDFVSANFHSLVRKKEKL